MIHGNATLAWALLHFLWQGALIATALAVALRFAASPRVRYALACAALAAMTLAVPVTCLTAAAPPAPIALPPDAPAPPTGGQDSFLNGAPRLIDFALPWVPAIWFLGAALFLLRLPRAAWSVRRATRGASPIDGHWNERLRHLAASLGVARTVRLLESTAGDGPWQSGIWRPVILAPAGMLAGMAPAAVEAILLHELAHIRRHDYLVNLIQSVVESLLFYHPAVWWVSSVIRREREHCCDDIAAARTEPAGYAQALLDLELRRGAPSIAAAAASGPLKARIERILSPSRSAASVSWPAIAAISAALAVFAAAPGQTPAPAPQPKPAAATPRPDPGPSPAPDPRDEEIRRLRAEIARLKAEATRATPGDREARELARRRAEQDREHAEVNRVEAGRAISRSVENYVERQVEQRIEQRLQAMLQRRDRNRAARPTSVPGPYGKWLDEDVAYIITAKERANFEALRADSDREKFVEEFWRRRDPDPSTPENPAKEEHYRRIAYANERFAEPGTPGWRTDRGRAYIRNGPPDEIEVHPGKFEAWRYRQGVEREIRFDGEGRRTP
ncbi:MAG: GWxTD domain-containing protein [Bryobacteraceae bacterium]